jgi:hypothetical protein
MIFLLSEPNLSMPMLSIASSFVYPITFGIVKESNGLGLTGLSGGKPGLGCGSPGSGIGFGVGRIGFVT